MATPGLSVAIALNRFGLGGRPDEVPPANPQNYLLDQLDRFEVRPLAYATLPDANELAQQYVEQQRQQRQAKQAADPKDGAEAKTALQMVRLQTRDAYRSGVNARLAAALASDTRSSRG